MYFVIDSMNLRTQREDWQITTSDSMDSLTYSRFFSNLVTLGKVRFRIYQSSLELEFGALRLFICEISIWE